MSVLSFAGYLMKIVGIGGGTGLPALLGGLRQLRELNADGTGRDRVQASAIVCVSDDGGSSGMLRRSFPIPAVGDLRNCLIALSSGSPALREIFQYRLPEDSGLDGHSLGNLIVAALSDRSGNLRQAIRLASEFLGLQGEVFPCTETSASLCAQFVDGEIVCGETRIAALRKKILRVWLDPADAPPTPGVIETLLTADAIVLGPGSLYTSVIPNLLLSGIAKAIVESRALKILVCNLMTQPGETEFYPASEHVKVIQGYLGESGLQICVLNSTPVPNALAARYASAGSVAVLNDEDGISKRGVIPISLDLLSDCEHEARHDSLKLARWVVALTRAYRRSRELQAGSVRCVTGSARDAIASLAVEAAS